MPRINCERTELDLTALVDHYVTDWPDQFTKKRRQIVVTSGVVQPVIGTPGLIGQILNVLMENSLRHGRGTVALLVSDTSVLVEPIQRLSVFRCSQLSAMWSVQISTEKAAIPLKSSLCSADDEARMFVWPWPNGDPPAVWDSAVENEHRRRVGDLTLDDPLQRTRAERRVVALMSELGHGCIVNVEPNPLRIESPAKIFKLRLDDGVQIFF